LILLGDLQKAQVRSTVSGYSFILEKWENLKMAVEAASNLRFEFSRADCNGRSSRAWFVCIGQTEYGKVWTRSRRKPSAGTSSSRQLLETRDRSLRTRVAQVCRTLSEEALTGRIQVEQGKWTTLKASADCTNDVVDAIAGAEPSQVVDMVKEQIDFALTLNLKRRPRLTRSGDKEITVHKRKQANDQEKGRIHYIASLWGWKDPQKTYAERQRIAMAACNLCAYDFGFGNTLAYRRLSVWDGELEKSLETGEGAGNCLSPKHAGRNGYTAEIDRQHPGYLRELFRYATKVKGARASYEELAATMNLKSAAPGEDRPEVSLSRKQLRDWFKANNGKEKSTKEKSLLDENMKRRRCEWAKEKEKS
jgi:hypothetical protein